MPADQPFSCKVESDELVIRIGINVLSYAANSEYNEVFWPNDEVTGFPVQRWVVIDPLEWAKDIKCELTREEEDGSSPLTNLLDKMFEKALDQGSLGAEECPHPQHQ